MSDKEMMKIDALEIKVGHINTAIAGDENLGIPGLVKMLQAHIDQSAKNSEEMRGILKDFKRDQVLEYAQQFNHVEEKYSDLNKKVKLLEESDKKEGNRLGFAAVVGGAVGTAIGFLISVFK